MQNPLFLKAVVVTALAVVLLVPLLFVTGKISERSSLRDGVAREIAVSDAGAQRLQGIVIVFPCTERYEEETVNDKGVKITQTRTRDCTRHLIPGTLNVSGQIETEVRHRGIYRVPVYRAKLRLHGQFDLPVLAGDQAAEAARTREPAFLSLGLQDIRGIRSVPSLAWNGAAVPFLAGPGKAPWPAGVHAVLAGLDVTREQRAEFSFELDLGGMERFDIVPSGANVQVALRSGWPDPGFSGNRLPDRREVGAEGFNASWTVSEFATGIRDALVQCARGRCEAWYGTAFGVAFVQTVDVYQRTYRTANYGFLFIVLTFAAFFLYEVLRGLRIHPAQYTLVGAGLALFFLLLLALSEHVAFGLAYTLAAAACVALIAFYVSFVLRGIARGLGFGALLAVLYGVMYLLLGQEDYALLMGSLLLLAVLAAFMYFTRRLDWYALTAPAKTV